MKQSAHCHALTRMLQLRYVLAIALFGLGAAQAKDFAPYSHEEFFDHTRLVRVELTVKPADWDTLRFQHRSLLKTLRTDVPPTEQEKQFDYFPADLTIDGKAIGKVAIRKKGFVGSMDDRRPSLKIKLDRYDSKKKYADLDTLTLNNNKQDPTDINQVIGYQVFRDAGLPAPMCNFATVTVNGEHLGVYCNLESPDKRFLKRTLDDDKGAFYEGTIADFDDLGLIRFERKFGKKKRDKKLAAIAEALKLEDDEMFEALDEVLDLKQFYRFWAMECLLGHWDGYVSNKNNYFVYYHSDQKRVLFLPWGMDQLAEDNNMFWGPQFKPPKSVKADGAIARRLYQTETGKKHYFAALEDLLDTVWNEEQLIARVKELEALIAPHQEHTGQRWRQTGKPMAEFIAERRSQIEAELETGYPEWTLGEREMPPRVSKVGSCEVTFTFTMVEIPKDNREFHETEGSATVSLQLGEDEIQFNSPVTIRKNPGWRGSSYSLQFSAPEATESGRHTLEVTFPSGGTGTERPVRVDVFASPGNARLLAQAGNVGEEGTRGSLNGKLSFTQYTTEAGETLSGTLSGDMYQFQP